MLDALADPEPTWITLDPAWGPPPESITVAIDGFDAGPRPAALRASQWLRESAITSSANSRTRLLIAEGRIAGFHSLASSTVKLRQGHRRSIGVLSTLPFVPATLVTWIGKDHRSQVDGRELILHAAATARRAAALQATTVLVVDPIDADTANMWRDRFGFRPSAEAGPLKRLWLPLETES